MKTTKYALLSALITIGSTQAASVVYNFTGDTTIANSAATKTSDFTSNDFGAGVTMSVFSLNTEVRNSSITDTHGFAANDMHAFQTFSNGQSTMSVTISVDSEHILDLSSLSFLYGVYSTANPLNTSYTLTSSLGGIDTNSTNSLTSIKNNLVSDTYTSTLGAPLKGLTDTEVTFTWAFANSGLSSTTNADRGHAMDNIVLNGTVSAVPEPSSTALLGLGGLALILRRRK